MIDLDPRDSAGQPGAARFLPGTVLLYRYILYVPVDAKSRRSDDALPSLPRLICVEARTCVYRQPKVDPRAGKQPLAWPKMISGLDAKFD